MIEELNKGFLMYFSPERHVLRVRIWGFWDIEAAQEYVNTLQEKIADIQAREQEWCVLADFINFYPRSEEVQHIMSRQLDTMKKQGMKKIAYLGERLWIQLQLARLFLSCDKSWYAFFESEVDAIQWLLSERECHVCKQSNFYMLSHQAIGERLQKEEKRHMKKCIPSW